MNDSEDATVCVDSKPYQAQLSLENYIVPALFLLVFILGVIANLTVIYIIFRKHGMKTIPNLLLVNLSLCDVVLLFGYMAFYIPSYIFFSFYGGTITCRLWTFLKLNTLGVGIFTLTFMAVDRFQAITKPLHRQALSKKALMLVISGIWFVAFILAMPMTINSEVRHIPIEDNITCWTMSICYSSWKATIINNYNFIVWIKFAIYFAAPFIVITFCYVAIFLSLCSHENTSLHVANNDFKNRILVPRRQMEARRKLAVMVLVLVLIFVVCRLPHESHAIFLEHNGMSLYWWQAIGNILSYIYSCVNPVILCILSPTFRKYMFKIWFPCIVHNDDPDTFQSMPLNYTNVNIMSTPRQDSNVAVGYRGNQTKTYIFNTTHNKDS